MKAVRVAVKWDLQKPRCESRPRCVHRCIYAKLVPSLPQHSVSSELVKHKALKHIFVGPTVEYPRTYEHHASAELSLPLFNSHTKVVPFGVQRTFPSIIPATEAIPIITRISATWLLGVVQVTITPTRMVRGRVTSSYESSTG